MTKFGDKGWPPQDDINNFGNGKNDDEGGAGFSDAEGLAEAQSEAGRPLPKKVELDIDDMLLEEDIEEALEEALPPPAPVEEPLPEPVAEPKPEKPARKISRFKLLIIGLSAFFLLAVVGTVVTLHF